MNQIKRDEIFDVIVDDQVPFFYVTNMRGMLGKIGYSNIKYYVYSKGGDRMEEVIMGEVQPLRILPREITD